MAHVDSEFLRNESCCCFLEWLLMFIIYVQSLSLSLFFFTPWLIYTFLSGTVLLPNFDCSILCLSFCQCFPAAHDQRTFCTCIFKESAARSQIGGAIFLERSYHVHFNVHFFPPCFSSLQIFYSTLPQKISCLRLFVKSPAMLGALSIMVNMVLKISKSANNMQHTHLMLNLHGYHGSIVNSREVPGREDYPWDLQALGFGKSSEGPWELYLCWFCFWTY